MNKILHFIFFKYFKIIPMNKLLKLFKTIYCKYKNLKKEYWTHILNWLTYIYYFIGIIIYNDVNKCPDTFLFFMYFITIPYLFFISLLLIPAVISLFHFNKLKITNNFLLNNEIYNIIWNIGNLLFIITIIILVYLIY